MTALVDKARGSNTATRGAIQRTERAGPPSFPTEATALRRTLGGHRTTMATLYESAVAESTRTGDALSCNLLRIFYRSSALICQSAEDFLENAAVVPGRLQPRFQPVAKQVHSVLDVENASVFAMLLRALAPLRAPESAWGVTNGSDSTH